MEIINKTKNSIKTKLLTIIIDKIKNKTKLLTGIIKRVCKIVKYIVVGSLFLIIFCIEMSLFLIMFYCSPIFSIFYYIITGKNFMYFIMTIPSNKMVSNKLLLLMIKQFNHE
jgi:hypothetical protein